MPNEPEKPQEALGRELTDLYDKSDFSSQRALADAAHYGPTTINMALNGRRRPTPEVIAAIVRACLDHTENASAGDTESHIARLGALRDRIGGDVLLIEETPPDPGGTMGGRRWGGMTRRARRRPRLTAAIVVLVLLLVAGGYAVYHAATSCGGGVALIEGECVGLADGSVPLLSDEPPALTTLREAILRENNLVLDSGRPWVSMVYVFPWAAGDDPEVNEQLPVPALLHELEGALVAQREANHTATFGTGPQLRLLLGNEGRGASHYDYVVDALRERVGADPNSTDNSQHIVSVVMTGKSVQYALDAIDQITALHLPLITTRLTSDQIQGGVSSARSVTRIAPSLRDGIEALSRYLRPRPRSAVLVQSLDPADNYAKALGQAFVDNFPGAITAAYPYDPHATAQDMSTVIGNICADPIHPDTILFAGRSSELDAFVEALPGRLDCSATHFTIATASDAIDSGNAVAVGDGLTRNTMAAGLSANTTLYYASIASRQAWYPPYAAPGSNPPLLSTDFPAQFPDDDLDDGAAIIGHDAVQTTISTVRFQGIINDTPARVAQVLHERTGRYAIPLASGPLSVGPDGRALNKAVPIMQIQPTGTPTLATVAYPQG